jgi:hypothetical protein
MFSKMCEKFYSPLSVSKTLVVFWNSSESEEKLLIKHFHRLFNKPFLLNDKSTSYWEQCVS